MNKNIKRLKKIFSASFISVCVSFLCYHGCKSKESKLDYIVKFSPKGGCLNLVINTIAKARKEIRVQAYCFTSKQIAQALINAKRNHNIKISILIDKSQIKSKYSMVRYFLKNNIPVFIDKVNGLAHNKIMIIDDTYVLTGSYNWTNAAEARNSENLLLLKSKNLAKIYKKNWFRRKRKAHAVI